MWMRPATGADVATVDATGAPRLAGADPAAERSDWEVTAVAVLAGAAIVVFGVIPSPLLNLADSAAKSLGLL
jgi:NADH-quinone oxidoreductase subunit N